MRERATKTRKRIFEYIYIKQGKRTLAMLHYKEYVISPETDWVVFIHGAGGSSSIWFKQVREFRKNFNVLLIDLRGHGKSQSMLERYKAENYTFKEISLEILEVLDHLGIQSAHFVGISLGTIIIRTIGEIAPERIKSMVMGGAITRFNTRSKILIFLGHLVERFIPYMWLYSFFAWIIMPRRRHRNSRMMFINEAKKLCQREFIRWFRLTDEANPLLKYFTEKEIPVPTLYLMGDEDYMFLPPVKTLVKKHRYAELQIIENSGHVCNVDQPESFNALAIEFIQRQIKRMKPLKLSAQ